MVAQVAQRNTTQWNDIDTTEQIVREAAQLRAALEASTTIHTSYYGGTHPVQRVQADYAEHVREPEWPEDDRLVVLEVIGSGADQDHGRYSFFLTAGSFTWELNNEVNGRHITRLTPERIVTLFPGLEWIPMPL